MSVISVDGKDWPLSFPFAVQRAAEDRFQKGWLGVLRMVMPMGVTQDDLKDPVKAIEALENIRVGVLVGLIALGTGMAEEEAERAYQSLGLAVCIAAVLNAVNGEAAPATPAAEAGANAPARPPKKKATRTR